MDELTQKFVERMVQSSKQKSTVTESRKNTNLNSNQVEKVTMNLLKELIYK